MLVTQCFFRRFLSFQVYGSAAHFSILFRAQIKQNQSITAEKLLIMLMIFHHLPYKTYKEPGRLTWVMV